MKSFLAVVGLVVLGAGVYWLLRSDPIEQRGERPVIGEDVEPAVEAHAGQETKPLATLPAIPATGGEQNEATLTVVTVDSRGEPIVGVAVEVAGSSGLLADVTDEQGSADFAVEPGRCEIRCPGLFDAPQKSAVVEVGKDSLRVFVGRKGCLVEVEVLDPSGQLVPEARIRCRGPELSRVLPWTAREPQVSLPPEQVSLQAFSDGFGSSDVESITISPEEVHDRVTLTLQRNYGVFGCVTLSGAMVGVDLPFGIAVRLLPASGDPLQSMEVYSRSKSSQVASSSLEVSDPCFELAAETEGRYLLVAEIGRTPLASGVVELSPDWPFRRVDLEIEEPGSDRSVIAWVYADGSLVRDVRFSVKVSSRRSIGHSSQPAIRLADGSYRVILSALCLAVLDSGEGQAVLTAMLPNRDRGRVRLHSVGSSVEIQIGSLDGTLEISVPRLLGSDMPHVSIQLVAADLAGTIGPSAGITLHDGKARLQGPLAGSYIARLVTTEKISGGREWALAFHEEPVEIQDDLPRLTLHVPPLSTIELERSESPVPILLERLEGGEAAWRMRLEVDERRVLGPVSQGVYRFTILDAEGEATRSRTLEVRGATRVDLDRL